MTWVGLQCHHTPETKEPQKEFSLFHATKKNVTNFNCNLPLDTGATFSSVKNKKVVTHVEKAEKPMTVVTQTRQRMMENAGTKFINGEGRIDLIID